MKTRIIIELDSDLPDDQLADFVESVLKKSAIHSTLVMEKNSVDESSKVNARKNRKIIETLSVIRYRYMGDDVLDD